MCATIATGTQREPGIAMGVVLQRTRPGLASVTDVAIALNVLAAIICDTDDCPPLQVSDAHAGGIAALAIVEHGGAPLIVSGGYEGALRGWRLDGTPAPLQIDTAHDDEIAALAVVEHDGAPLIVSGGSRYDGALLKWRRDDTPGPLLSWRLDGTPGPLQVDRAHDGGTAALAIVEHGGGPLIVSGGRDGALRSWRVAELDRLVALEHPAARDVEVRELSLGSLETVLHLPPDVLATTALAATSVVVLKLAKILDAVKRVAGFRAELRLQDREQLAQQVRAEAELLAAEDALASATALHRRRQLQAAGWEFEGVVVSNDDDAVL